MAIHTVLRKPVLTILSAAASSLLDLVVPPRCILCGAFHPSEQNDRNAVTDFCEPCRSGMLSFPRAYCPRCGRPFETSLSSNHPCGQCLKSPPPYDRAVSAGLYRENLRRAIHQFKYTGCTELAGPLALFMAARIESPFYPPRTDLIIPVPLHARRLKERGFNQALLLARALYKPWKDLIRFDILIRGRWTDPQVSLKGDQRRKSLKRAFNVPHPAGVKDRSILIVDDVYTTGTTLSECARTLKKAGAREVLAVTLARVA